MYVCLQSLGCIWLFATPWTAAHQTPLSFIILWSLRKFMCVEPVMLLNYLIRCCPLLLLPSIFPSIRVFSSESALLIMWPKFWSFSFSISPFNEYSGLISFRIDWFDLAVHETLKSLLQNHNSTVSFLQCSDCFMVQLSHPYVTTGKTIALTIQTFVSKVLSLFFNKLSRFVMAFLPRNKSLSLSWLQSLSVVILEPKKLCHCFHFFPSTCHEVMGLDAMILVFWILSFKPVSSLSSFIFIKKFFFTSSAIRVHLPWKRSIMKFCLRWLGNWKVPPPATWELGTQESWWSSFKAWGLEGLRWRLQGGSESKAYLHLLFVLLRPPAGWTRPTHIGRGSSALPDYSFNSHLF